MVRYARVWLPVVAVVGSLVLRWPVSGRRSAGHPLDPEQSEIMDMLEFVLANDEDWTSVLEKNVRLNDRNRPEYHGRSAALAEDTRAKLRLVDDAAVEISPWPVLRKVANEFAWLDSHVKYAARVFRTAFMCVAVEYLSLLMELIVALNDKFAENHVGGTAHDAFERTIRHGTSYASSLLTVFVDKLAALGGGLDRLADLAYLYAQFAERTPDYFMYAMVLMRREFETGIDAICVRTHPNDIYRRFKVDADHDYLKGKESSAESILSAFERVAGGMLDEYENLRVHSLPVGTWNGIFDFHRPIANDVEFYLNVEKMLSKDSLGRQMLREKWERRDKLAALKREQLLAEPTA